MRPTSWFAGAAAAIVASLLSGCLSFVWSRDRAYQPLPQGSLADLEVGQTTLSLCLERLGAPLYVWEYKGDGAALAWGYQDDNTKRISFSIPINRGRASVSYGDIAARLKGAVLLFDRGLVLEQVKEGYLRTIRGDLERARPAPVEESHQDEKGSP